MRALIVLGCRKGKEKKTDGRWFWWLPDPLTGPVISGSPALRPGTLELKSLAEINAEADKAKALANPTKKRELDQLDQLFLSNFDEMMD